MHYGGASEYAVNYFGAIMGLAEGPQGDSYAIPTDVVSLEEIKYAINIFTNFAIAFPELTFWVTENRKSWKQVEFEVIQGRIRKASA